LSEHYLPAVLKTLLEFTIRLRSQFSECPGRLAATLVWGNAGGAREHRFSSGAGWDPFDFWSATVCLDGVDGRVLPKTA
jgi:hypothetical protein